jgi:hypothetical protein
MSQTETAQGKTVENRVQFTRFADGSIRKESQLAYFDLRVKLAFISWPASGF